MSEKTLIELKEAKHSFIELMRSLNKFDQQKFLEFILKEWEPKMFCNAEDNTCNKAKKTDDSIFLLNSIVSDIKQKIPFDCVLPSENITTPLSGENSDCDPNITLHIDEFLYDDEDIDELVDSGQLQRYYCVNCGSKNIKPLIFISHSMPRDIINHIFNTLLPALKGKTVLDIGSRLGAVLYGAYIYTDAEKIIGVEMNEELCNLQNDIIHKYKMNDRITILHNRIEETPEIIKKSDIIIMNNVFEFYLSHDVQIDIWKFLRNIIKQGTILITRPSVETTMKSLNTGISVDKWLKPLNTDSNLFHTLSTRNENVDKYAGITCYKVL